MPDVLRVSFAQFELDLETGELWKRKRKVSLSPKPFRLLVLLIRSPGQLVTRESLKEELWGHDTFVDFEHGLNFCIREIRTALGDNARKPKFIETLPRRGYRFVSPVLPYGRKAAARGTSIPDSISAAPSPEAAQIESYDHYSRARKCLIQVGKESLEEALQEFQKALTLNPDFALAHSGLGAAYALRNINRRDPADLEMAQRQLERSLALDAELAEPYPWLCFVYNRQGRLDLAVETGHHAIRLQPELVQAHYFLGLAYFVRCESGADDYQSAVRHLLSATRVGPNWQATWFVLAFLASLVGAYDEARNFGRQLSAMSTQPGGLPFIGAEIVLGAVELRQGRPEGAVALLEGFLERMEISGHMYRDSMSAIAACGLGDVYLREGQAAQALTAYRRAWQMVQEHPRMMAHLRISARTLAGLSAAYFAEGNRERASGLLRRAMALTQRAVAPAHCAAAASLAELFLCLAGASLRAGDRDQALDLVSRAVQSGWRDPAWLEADPELQPLRSEPRFQNLVARLRFLPGVEFASVPARHA